MLMMMDMVIFRSFIYVFIQTFIWYAYQSVWTFLPCTVNMTVTFPFNQVKAATELDKITRS